MSTVAATRRSISWSPRLIAWLPVLALPALAAALTAHASPWIFMWALAFASFVSFKWLTYASYAAEHSVSFGRAAAYLLLWPGMDAPAFFAVARARRPALRELATGIANVSLGVSLLAGGIYLLDALPFVAGWLGMIGLVLVLHFGVARVQSYALRCAGIAAPPIMNAPLYARSLADFWGKRWNLAFRDVMHAFVFRPLVPRLGAAAATLAVFLVSGIIHDVVISAAAGAGYGLPTLYFLIHGLALLFERSRTGRALGLGRGIRGRLFGAVVVLAPVSLLFYPPFVENVAVPMLRAIASTVVTP